jgi:hypothetical protein
MVKSYLKECYNSKKLYERSNYEILGKKGLKSNVAATPKLGAKNQPNRGQYLGYLPHNLAAESWDKLELT